VLKDGDIVNIDVTSLSRLYGDPADVCGGPIARKADG